MTERLDRFPANDRSPTCRQRVLHQSLSRPAGGCW